uniref:Secreted protein n=1 Tax=Hippocampus comes TaxID=109280 RepID=A0A3Q3E0E6_HIPCM
MMSDLLSFFCLLLQHELGELVPVTLSLHVQVKIVIIGDGVRAEGVCAHIRVEGVLHWEARPGDGTLGYFHRNIRLGKTGWIVVDIHHFNLDAKEFQRARDGLLADFFPVNFLPHHNLESASRKFGYVQPQILRDIPNHCPGLLLLCHGVAELRERSIQEGDQKKQTNHVCSLPPSALQKRQG